MKTDGICNHLQNIISFSQNTPNEIDAKGSQDKKQIETRRGREKRKSIYQAT